jgi:hypothetical protein
VYDFAPPGIEYQALLLQLLLSNSLLQNPFASAAVVHVAAAALAFSVLLACYNESSPVNCCSGCLVIQQNM